MTDAILSKIKNQQIWVGHSILGKIAEIIPLNKYSSIAILTDRNVSAHWLAAIKKAVKREVVSIIIPAGEKSKTIAQAEHILMKMMKAKMDRHSLLINLGGGVVGDLGGFVASIFMRGIDFVQIPTTLLAMVDASCGGKTGVNLQGVKNIVGTFKNPSGVIIDASILGTLPKRELVSGFAEVIKHEIISGRHFENIRAKKLDKLDHHDLAELITDSIEVKLKVVDKDPKEIGLRKILNFGHTIGHALETLSHKTSRPLLHGEAVAIGMVAECRLSRLLGLLSQKETDMIVDAIEKNGLPIKIEGIDLKDVMELIIIDKKNRKTKVNWSLPKAIGSVVFNVQADDELVVEAIKSIAL